RGDQRRDRDERNRDDRGPRSDRERDNRREEERRPPRREEPAPRRGFGDGLVEDWPPETHPEPASGREYPAAESFESEDFVARETEFPAAEERLGFDRPADDE